MNKSSSKYDVVIVGAGVGGISAVESVLSLNLGKSILLLNEEEWAPYDRPPLSKEVLLGQAQTADIALLNDTLRDHPDLRIKNGTAASHLDRQNKLLGLTDGSSVTYGTLILATGSKTRKLDPSIIDSECSSSILYLKTLTDTEALRALLVTGNRRKVVIIGGGFIGLEVAATATRLGCEVTVLEAGSRIVGRGAPQAVAGFIKARHESAGVRFILDAQASRLSSQGAGQQVRLTLTNGETLFADTVVVGIGTIANDMLAGQAGILCDNGILVDQHCRTNDPDIYAIGDVARLSSGNGIRMEHWQAAHSMGAVAARNACGASDVFDELPWLWTDQYENNIQFLGYSSDRNQHLTRRGTADGKWILFEKNAGVVVAATLINSGRDRRSVERLIVNKCSVPDDKLLDPKFDLKSILR